MILRGDALINTRRTLFKKLGAWSCCLLFGDFLKSKGSDLKNYYRVVIVNTSGARIKEKSQYENESDFWDLNYDEFADELNKKFISSGRLIKIKSILSRSKRSLILVKYYRSKADHRDYVNELKDYHLSRGYSHKVLSKELELKS